jgi:hypothetical protein
MDKMRFVKMDLEDSPRDDGLDNDEDAPGAGGSNASVSAIFQLAVNGRTINVVSHFLRRISLEERKER